eukprot:365042-Chlamydomonas_euryale.AAC.15
MRWSSSATAAARSRCLTSCRPTGWVRATGCTLLGAAPATLGHAMGAVVFPGSGKAGTAGPSAVPQPATSVERQPRRGRGPPAALLHARPRRRPAAAAVSATAAARADRAAVVAAAAAAACARLRSLATTPATS